MNTLIHNNEFVIFDLFVKNNMLYIISPCPNPSIDVCNFKIINKTDISDIELVFYEELNKINYYESFQLFIFISNNESIFSNININYYNCNNSYKVENIISTIKYKLVLTTLFKDDYKLFPIFYNYYKKQGINHFYMYYNGIVNDDIKLILTHEDVTLIEWDYRYWSQYKDRLHYAQSAHIHHSLYRYGKDNSEYIIFCDLDEYLYIPNKTIKEYIIENKDIDHIKFLNYWSETTDKLVPTNFPTEFKFTNCLKYTDRSKNLYKTDKIKQILIHYPETNNTLKSSATFYMFHFYNWTRITRQITNQLFTNTFPNYFTLI